MAITVIVEPGNQAGRQQRLNNPPWRQHEHGAHHFGPGSSDRARQLLSRKPAELCADCSLPQTKVLRCQPDQMATSNAADTGNNRSTPLGETDLDNP